MARSLIAVSAQTPIADVGVRVVKRIESPDSAADSIRTKMPTAGDLVGAFPLVGSPISR